MLFWSIDKYTQYSYIEHYYYFMKLTTDHT